MHTQKRVFEETERSFVQRVGKAKGSIREWRKMDRSPQEALPTCGLQV